MQVCMNHPHMLNSYQQNLKNKIEICSTKNEMHAGKKAKTQPQAKKDHPGHIQ